MGSSGGYLVVVALVVGSLSVSSGCETRVALGERCESDAQCPAGLSCTVGGRCRVGCTTSRDCGEGERCLADPTTAVRACSLATDVCTTDCEAGLECVAGQCQTRCATDADCPDAYCGPSGACLPLGPSVRDVDVGLAHACAVTSSGEVYCWGYFPGIGVREGAPDCEGTCFARPTAIGLDAPAVHVAAGGDFSCAILEDGRVFCWGDLDTNGTLPPVEIEPPFGGHLHARAIAAGRTHACVVDSPGAPEPDVVRCWGSDQYGQIRGALGGDFVVGASPIAGMAPGELSLSAYASFSFADGRATGLGENDDAELGRAASPTEPAGAVPGESRAIAAAIDVTCALDAAGTPRCWGRRSQLLGDAPADVAICRHGDVDYECTTTPSVLDAGDALVGLAADAFGDAALGWNAAGQLFGWGSSSDLVLSRENLSSPTPQPVLDGRTTHRVAIGNGTACAILDDTEALVCWGRNTNAQLGRGAAGDPSPDALPPAW